MPSREILKTSIAVILAVSLLGCSDPADGPDTPHTDPRDATEAVVPSVAIESPFDSMSLAGLTCPVLMDSVFLAPASRAKLLDSYGAPDSIVVVTEPNRHVAGTVDSLFVVYCPDLYASFRKPGGGSDPVSEIAVTDNRYLRYPGIGIGARSERLLHVLGDPTEIAVDRVEFDAWATESRALSRTVASGAAVPIAAGRTTSA